MTTETTSQPAVETLEEIAHKIVKRYLDDYINDHQLEQQILSALRNRDERAAKMVLERRWMFDHELAAAIREGQV